MSLDNTVRFILLTSGLLTCGSKIIRSFIYFIRNNVLMKIVYMNNYLEIVLKLDANIDTLFWLEKNELYSDDCLYAKYGHCS